MTRLFYHSRFQIYVSLKKLVLVKKVTNAAGLEVEAL
jgi:hypothetical protein